MARVPLTEAEAERIVQGQKRITQDVRWYQVNPNESWIKCELDVKTSMRVNLKLYLNQNIDEPSLFSLSLILNNVYRIRGLDVNGSHKNRHSDNEHWQAETHKHKWTDRCRDSFAYTPSEITANAIDEIFSQFCDECNIAFSGRFISPPSKQLMLEEIR